MGGGGGGQKTIGARGGGKSRPRDAVADAGPENAASGGRSSNPKRTGAELCACGGCRTPHDVPAATGDGRWNEGRSCFTPGAIRPEPAYKCSQSTRYVCQPHGTLSPKTSGSRGSPHLYVALLALLSVLNVDDHSLLP